MERFWINLQNNLIWLLVFIVPTAALGLLLAYGLELSGDVASLFRPLFLYPMALSFVVTGTVWAWMYDPDAGVINNILRNIGLGSFVQPWIADPQEATLCLIGAAIWQYTGFAMTLYLAAIRDIPREIIEAAKVDGASEIQLFFYVIVPNVGHATMISIAMLTLFTLKVFDLVWVMTFGGPGNSTEVLPFFMFVATFRQQLVGLGAAISVIILLLAIAVVIPYSWWSMRRLQT
jgi:ABC-type sugar transport system permease subunit